MMSQEILANKGQDTEEHWISISDMMAGLMVIFLFIAISYMLYVSAEKKRIEKIVEVYVTLQSDLYADLMGEFEKDLKTWKARLEETTLSIRFKQPFERGKSVVPDDFKEILDTFFPRYVRILRKYKDDIAEVRIEGHTSSEWTGFQHDSNVNEEIDYFLNMKLSQDRARKCLTYVLGRIQDGHNRKWIKDKLTANGLSSSKLVDGNGELVSESKLPEDPKKSRRVEFRVRANAEKRIVAILEELSKQGKGN